MVVVVGSAIVVADFVVVVVGSVVVVVDSVVVVVNSVVVFEVSFVIMMVSVVVFRGSFLQSTKYAWLQIFKFLSNNVPAAQSIGNALRP